MIIAKSLQRDHKKDHFHLTSLRHYPLISWSPHKHIRPILNNTAGCTSTPASNICCNDDDQATQGTKMRRHYNGVLFGLGFLVQSNSSNILGALSQNLLFLITRFGHLLSFLAMGGRLHHGIIGMAWHL